ncbi:ATP-binding cassette domain-containing protein [Mollicutes bacterium LVI A0078]|nr:ATP-binding cassette domain-containing protein [Mollicutes bacterium LVI A0075]WOO91535.1 ATP-binding cassette domain-containing protein [Mollicutes bacterium LVI A0078]
MNLLKIENLAIIYQYAYLFDELNFSLNKGERLVIIGESGSGKSSILNAIIGAIEYEGSIEINTDVSYMPQSLALLDHKTVRGNVELPRIIRKLEQIADDEYNQFGLEQYIDTYVSKLSGGQRQRVALMRALYSGGSLLLFDEPLSKLDQINKERMMDYFLNHITDDYGLVYITHDLNEAVKIGTKILVLSEYPQMIDNNLETDVMKTLLKEMLKTNIEGEQDESMYS